MDDEAQKTKLNFSLIATPAEGLSGRFVKIDRKIYGSIPGVTDREYYTNSFHYDVRKNPTPFEKLEFEKDYPVYASGGSFIIVNILCYNKIQKP